MKTKASAALFPIILIVAIIATHGRGEPPETFLVGQPGIPEMLAESHVVPVDIKELQKYGLVRIESPDESREVGLRVDPGMSGAPTTQAKVEDRIFIIRGSRAYAIRSPVLNGLPPRSIRWVHNNASVFITTQPCGWRQWPAKKWQFNIKVPDCDEVPKIIYLL